MPQIHKSEQLDLLYQQAVDQFFDAVDKVAGSHVLVALPGGRSIVPFLNALVQHAEALPLDAWHRLEFFMVDERAVPVDHDDSNFKIVERHLSQLVDELILRKRQLHPYMHDSSKPEESIAAYSAQLHEIGEGFDIVCLGIGEDGHVAGLFPNHPALSSAENRFIYFEDSPKPPPKRITASKSMILNSTTALLFAIGEGKLEAARSLLSESGDIASCPARMILSIPNSHIFTNLDVESDGGA